MGGTSTSDKEKLSLLSHAADIGMLWPTCLGRQPTGWWGRNLVALLRSPVSGCHLKCIGILCGSFQMFLSTCQKKMKKKKIWRLLLSDGVSEAVRGLVSSASLKRKHQHYVLHHDLYLCLGRMEPFNQVACTCHNPSYLLLVLESIYLCPNRQFHARTQVFPVSWKCTGFKRRSWWFVPSFTLMPILYYWFYIFIII